MVALDSGPLVDLDRPRAAKGAAGRGRWGSVVRTLGGWLIFLVGWQLLAMALAGTRLIASPVGVVADIAANASLYLRALGYTGFEAVLGYLIGNAAAVMIALFVAVLPWTERIALRVSLVIYCLPLVAVGPLLRLIFGLNDGPQITLSALAVFYLTLVPLLVGLRAVPSAWTDLVVSYGRGRWTTLVAVRLRACVPYFVAGLQVTVPAAFLGALVGEFTGAERGLGVLSILALRSLDTDSLWALAVISAAASVVVYVGVGWLGHRLSPDSRTVLMALPPRRNSRGLGKGVLRGALEALITIALVIIGWIAFLRLFDLSPFFAKGPVQVWQWMVTGPAAAEHRAEIFGALGATIAVAVPGYVAGLLLGVGLSALFELFPSVRRTLTPIAVALRCVPIIAVAPLLVQALGRGAVGTTVVVAIMIFFPTLVSCLYGLRQTPGQITDWFAVYATPPWRVLLLARLPAMLPAFFAAARIAAPSAILAATVAEWLATGTGIGHLLAITAATSVYTTLWSAVVVVTIVAVVAYWLVELLERSVLRRVAPEQMGW